MQHLTALGVTQARESRHAEIVSHSLADALETPLEAHPPAATRTPRKSIVGNTGRTESSLAGLPRGAKKFEPFEVRRAIDKKDMSLLMEIRDTQFELLVSSLGGGGATPLLYSMRMGASREYPPRCFVLYVLELTLSSLNLHDR